MTGTREGSVRRLGCAAYLAAGVLVVLCTGCTRPLLERAIAARGGPLTNLSRDVEAEVFAGFPGTWSWRFDYRVPDLLRWTLETYGDRQSVAYDGRAVHFYLGSARIAEAPPALGDFRSQVRWVAVTTLDALASQDGATVRELPPGDLPPGARSGLDVTYDDGARYALYFDASDLLIAAEGPIVLPTIAAGRMRASYSEFGVADGFRLPYRGRYTLDAQPFFDEKVLRYVPNDPRLTAASFAGPPPPAGAR
jgi:hypothetical protein